MLVFAGTERLNWLKSVMEIIIMAKTMKQSTIKTVVAKVDPENVVEYTIDTDVFDDPFMEAATRLIEVIEKKKTIGAIIKHVVECWDKTEPKTSYVVYNTYWVLVNAGCYKKAERLRDKFKMQNDIDLASLPYHGTIKSKYK